jgi:hypothetical protein
MTGNNVPAPYRILFGLRNIDGGSNYTTVQATAVQSPMDASTTAACTRRRTSISATRASQAQARELAALLVGAADEADRWSPTMA